jgi:hypothetical protein
LAALAAAASACSRDDGQAEVRVVIENDASVPRPEHVFFSWLRCDEFFVRDLRVPQTGALLGASNPIATVVVRLSNTMTVERHALVIGVVGGLRTSIGIATAQVAPGAKTRLVVRLYRGVLLDADGDGSPDSVDRCVMGDGARPPQGSDAGPAQQRDAVAPSEDGRSGVNTADAATTADAAPDRAIDPPPAAAVDAPPDAAIVPPVNQPPSASAGPDLLLTEPTGEAILNGSVIDDGRPAPPGKLAVAWLKVSGPGDVTFVPANAPATRARFSRAGTYLLRLAVSDGQASAQDDVTVTVLDLDTGLAGWWRFDEASEEISRDSSGNGNHARLFDGASIVPGRIGPGALDLTKVGDQARVEHPPNGRLDFGAGDFTFALWLRTTQTVAQPFPGTPVPQVIAKVEDRSGVRLGYELRIDFDGLGFLVWLGRTTALAPIALGTNDGRWHHVVGRKNATEVAIFIDGRPGEVFPAVTGTVSNRAPLIFGAGVFGGDFQGVIDDVRLYPRALSDVEIGVLAQAP